MRRIMADRNQDRAEHLPFPTDPAISAVAMASVACCDETYPSETIAESTSARRPRAALGSKRGSYDDGACAIPASRASSAKLSSPMLSPKYRHAAAGTPYRPRPVGI